MISKQIEDELDRREYDRCEENWRDRYGIGGRRYYTRSGADDAVRAFSKSDIYTEVVEYGINEYYVHEV